MDERVASLNLEEIGLIQRMNNPLEVDTLFKRYKPMKRVLVKLVLPQMIELSQLFFIIDYFELVKKSDDTYRLDIHVLDINYEKKLDSIELGKLESELRKEEE